MKKLVIVLLSAAILLLLFGTLVNSQLNEASDPNNRPPLSSRPQVNPPQEEEPEELFEPRIGLYTGQGYWSEGIEAIKNFLDAYGIPYGEFDEQEASHADLSKSFDAVWFAGGFSEEYRHYISSHDNIRAYVENGGVFIGTCAGAYYAADTMLWGENRLDYPLKLFAGQAVGPHLSWGEHAALTLNPDLPVNAGFRKTIGVRYFDGPYFVVSDTQEVIVLAEYASNKAPAVLALEYGSGKVLLMGPHPELGYDPATSIIDTAGGGGAQWPWLYGVLQWLITPSS
ncbi:MAG: BPL-N domain-containing protein [Bacillota bacterium]